MVNDDEQHKRSEQQEQQYRDEGKKNLSSLDKWILSRLSRMVEHVNGALAEKNFHKAVAAIRQFIYYEFCDLYVVKSFGS